LNQYASYSPDNSGACIDYITTEALSIIMGDYIIKQIETTLILYLTAVPDLTIMFQEYFYDFIVFLIESIIESIECTEVISLYLTAVPSLTIMFQEYFYDFVVVLIESIIESIKSIIESIGCTEVILPYLTGVPDLLIIFQEDSSYPIIFITEPIIWVLDFILIFIVEPTIDVLAITMIFIAEPILQVLEFIIDFAIDFIIDSEFFMLYFSAITFLQIMVIDSALLPFNFITYYIIFFILGYIHPILSIFFSIPTELYFYLEHLESFFGCLDNMLLVLMLYFIFKSVLLSLVLELIWPTHIFNKKNNFSYTIPKKKIILEVFLKFKNHNFILSLFNIFFIKY